MKVKAGTERIDLEDFDALLWAAARDTESFYHSLLLISPEEWQRMRGDLSTPVLRAIPVYIAYIGHELGHRIYPAPAKDMEIQFCYWKHKVVV